MKIKTLSSGINKRMLALLSFPPPLFSRKIFFAEIRGSQAEMAAAAQTGQMADDAAIMDNDQQYGQQYP